METKMLHIRVEKGLHEDLLKQAQECGLASGNALATILLSSAIRAVRENGNRVLLPLRFEMKQDVEPATRLNEPEPKYPHRRAH